MGRRYLPALDEGVLPIRQAKEQEEIAEERRLLYVGITRTRRFLALSSFVPQAVAIPGGIGSGQPKATPSGWPGAAVAVRVLPGAPIGGARRRRRWPARGAPPLARERAAADAVPAYIVAHDTTLAESPTCARALFRRSAASVAWAPQKLEWYGPEILAVIDRAE